MSVIKVDIREKKYNEQLIFKDTKIEFFTGNIYLIQGRSGSGKSTLLRMIANLDDDYTGSIDSVDSILVNQESYLFLNMSVAKNITFGLDNYEDNLYNYIIKALSIEDLVDVKVKNLSGGQRQRVALSRCLLQKKAIILLDEPTKGLDYDNIIKLIECINYFNREFNTTFIITSHNEILSKHFINNIKLIDHQLVYDELVHEQKEGLINGIDFEVKKYRFIYFKAAIRKFIFPGILIIFIFLSLFFAKLVLIDRLDNDFVKINDSLNYELTNVQNIENYNNNYYDISIKDYEQIPDVVDQVGFYVNDDRDKNGNKLEDIKMEEEFFDSPQLAYLTSVWKQIFINNPGMPSGIGNTNIEYQFTQVYSNDTVNASKGLLNEYRGLSNIVYGSANLVDDYDIIIPLHLAYYLADDPESLIDSVITLNTDNGAFEYKVVGIYSEEDIINFNELGNIYTTPKVYNTYQEYYTDYPTGNQNPDVNAPAISEVVSTNNSLESTAEYTVISKDNYIAENEEDYKNFKTKQLYSYGLILLLLLIEMIVLLKLISSIFAYDYLVFKELGLTSKQINRFMSVYFVIYSIIIIIGYIFMNGVL